MTIPSSAPRTHTQATNHFEGRNKTMKTMKKLASVALALVMALCLTVPAFAQEVDAGENGGGSITVTNPAPEQTYNLYRIFELESFNGNAYSYKVNDTWRAFVTGEGVKDVYVTIDDQEYVTWVEGADVEAFAKAAILWAEGVEEVLNEDGTVKTPAVAGHIATPVATATAGTAAEPTEENPDPRAEAITFTGLKLGYYLISSTRGALCALDTTNKAANVTEKNVKPTIDKEAVELPDGIGDSVKYEVTVHAKKGAEKYVVHDTMSKGLSFNNDVVVTVGETTVDSSNYTVKTTGFPEDHKCTFEVIFEQAYLNTLTADNTDIVISYTATVTADAVEVDKLNNTAKLSYGNETTPEETLPDPVDISLYQFDLVKTNSDDMGKEVLTGAEFNLYNVAENGTPISLVFVAEHEETDDEGNTTMIPDYYRPAVEGETGTTTIRAGVATIKGLGAGTWYLEETKQPEGYNILKGRTSVEVGEDKDWTATIIPGTEANGDTPATPATWERGGVRIVNLTGAELPETGGIGTTIFYIVGGLLAVGAGVLLVTKKKMGADEE